MERPDKFVELDEATMKLEAMGWRIFPQEHMLMGVPPGEWNLRSLPEADEWAKINCRLARAEKVGLE